MKLLLDTNAFSAFMRNDPPTVAHVRSAEHLLVPATVVGEILFGFRNGSKYAENRAILSDFLESGFVSFLPTTIETSDRYALIATQLKRKGCPIPTNDIWIAAHTLESGSTLLSYDQHFSQIDGLSWIGS